MSDLVTMIDNLVNEKTFNLDAVTAINALKAKATAQQKTLEDVESQLNAYKKDNERLQRENYLFTNREAAITEREKKMIELEKSLAVADAVKTAYADQFNRMFANRVVRESNMTQQWVPSGQPNMGPVLMTAGNSVAKEEG